MRNVELPLKDHSPSHWQWWPQFTPPDTSFAAVVVLVVVVIVIMHFFIRPSLSRIQAALKPSIHLEIPLEPSRLLTLLASPPWASQNRNLTTALLLNRILSTCARRNTRTRWQIWWLTQLSCFSAWLTTSLHAIHTTDVEQAHFPFNHHHLFGGRISLGFEDVTRPRPDHNIRQMSKSVWPSQTLSLKIERCIEREHGETIADWIEFSWAKRWMIRRIGFKELFGDKTCGVR